MHMSIYIHIYVCIQTSRIIREDAPCFTFATSLDAFGSQSKRSNVRGAIEKSSAQARKRTTVTTNIIKENANT